MVSTTHDPATPYQAGVDLANQLHGGLLTFDGTQHTVVFQGNSCIDDYASAYILSGTVPSKGLSVSRRRGSASRAKRRDRAVNTEIKV